MKRDGRKNIIDILYNYGINSIKDIIPMLNIFNLTVPDRSQACKVYTYRGVDLFATDDFISVLNIAYWG